MNQSHTTMEKVVSLCKRRGIIFPGSEIYGGLANTWDYGPYGVELKNNVKKQWWQNFVQRREDIVGLDSAILMNPRIWEASGHVGAFSDPLIDCRSCRERFRADHIIEHHTKNGGKPGWPSDAPLTEKTPLGDMVEFIKKNIVCPSCAKGNWTEARKFNLMFKTHQGVIEDSTTEVYLRPETAQGIFVNFKNALETTRKKLPFGIAQIGKAFRNEITPGNFTFRTREFEQMEIEYFIEPDTAEKWFKSWTEESWNWFLSLGLNPENLRKRQHDKDELSHYSSMTVDIEYNFPFGWGELEGIAHRGSFDLTRHQEFSKQDLEYFDQEKNLRFLPHIIEPSFGADRTVLTFLLDAFLEEELENGEIRAVLKLHPRLAPIKAAILPLMKKEPLQKKAREIFENLKDHFMIEYDETGSIGKRYRRQDEIGTPYCVTVDFDTLDDETITIRDRDTLAQERFKTAELEGLLREKVNR